MSLIKEKNETQDRTLKTNLATVKEFRQQQWKVKRAVNMAKEDWILSVAKEAEEAFKDRKTCWECI